MHKIFCSAVALVLLASCTTMPARLDPPNDPNPPDIRTSIEQISRDEDGHRDKVAKSTFEYHDDFMVGFVEYDDQGWFHNHEQFETVQRQIEEVLLSGGRRDPAIIVSFIHGWRHTAAVCDRDTVCFREVLRGLAIYEKERAKVCRESPGGSANDACVERTVIGVMTGWRGAPIGKQAGRLESLNIFSFYSRKGTAHTIGQSGFISSVVGWLNQLDDKLPARSRLILAGHSFGGAMLFSSVAGVLNEQIAEARYAPGRDLIDCNTFRPEGVGDLIVLLNPAFEALRYASIDDRTKDLEGCTQRRTVLLTMASETDQANGFWFPFGRTLSTMFDRFREPKQRVQTRRAVGHYEDFQTHTLTANESSELDVFRTLTRKDPCACEYAVNEEAMRDLARAVHAPADQPRANVYAQLATPQDVCNTPSCLRPIGDKEAHNPFKVVRVDSKIIDGHSDIYNPRLLDFIVRSVASADDPRAAPPNP